MGSKYLMDSNAIIDYLSGNVAHSKIGFLKSVINEVPQISVVSQIEVLSKGSAFNFVSLAENFVADCTIHGLSNDIVSGTISLRRKYKIKTPDAIIAATALHYDLVLITADLKGFENIKGLKLLNQREEA